MHSVKNNNYINSNFAIIIPSRKIDNNLKYCISRIRDFYKKTEILIILDTIKNSDFYNKDKNIKIFFYNKKIGNKRNFAAKKTNKKYLVFIDSDAYPIHNWLNYSLNGLLKFKAVCGPNISSNINNIEKKIIANFRKIFFITYDIDFKIKTKKKKFVDFAPACNFVIDRKLYLKCGGMQENINSAEENYLMIRLKKLNKKIFFDGHMFVNHKERDIKSFFFQRANYGSSIIRLIQKKIFIKQSIAAILSCMPLLFTFLLPLLYFNSFFIIFLSLYLILFISLYAYTLYKLKNLRFFYLKSLIFLIGVFGTGIGLVWNVLFGNVIDFYKHNKNN